MKKIKFVVMFVVLGFFIACQGPYHKPEKKPIKIGLRDIAETSSESEDSADDESNNEVPPSLDNKGIGPIDHVDLGDEIDQDMAAAGEAYFNSVCIACHQIETRMVGPALKGVLDDRSPEWVMNMILNTNEMLEKDETAKALLEIYQAPMTYMGTTEQEARELVEYFRTVSDRD